ncbi:hypothetical protein KI387_005857, partial [Taxus chinensis]
YLIVRNVPALGCIDELVKLFGLYGPIEEYRLLDEEECEPFTDVYWIKFVHISNARFAKRKLDEYQFLGNLLQVTYAPNYETLLDTKDKLEERRHTVFNRLKSSKQKGPNSQATTSPVETDPLLDPFSLPGGVQRETDHSAYGISQWQEKSSYFSTLSMNATVQSVREKLDS